MKERIKKIVRERAKFCCEYCLARLEYSPDVFSIEHIIPKSKNGTDEIENLALSCQTCNNYKHTATHAIDSVSGLPAILFHPRNNLWTEHFIWSENLTQMIGITPTGRATVARLKLNRESLMNFRKVLHAANLHPPF